MLDGRRASGFVPVGQGGLTVVVVASRGVGFDSQSVIHGYAELRLASEVAFCRLNRDVAEQELDLIQFAAREMTETAHVRLRSWGASLSMQARAAAARTTSHSTFGDMPSPQIRPALLIARNTAPCVMAAATVHASTCLFTHVGMGTVRTCPPLPTRSTITQCSSRC
jgi:hypothetical protein